MGILAPPAPDGARAYASVEDVDDRWIGQPSFMQPLDTDLRDGVQRLLDDAHALLYVRVPDIDDRVTAGTTSYHLVTMVLCRAVIRVLRNPDGFRNASIGQISWSRDATAASGDLEFTAGDLAALGIAYSTAGIVKSVRMAEPSYRQSWNSGLWR